MQRNIFLADPNTAIDVVTVNLIIPEGTRVAALAVHMADGSPPKMFPLPEPGPDEVPAQISFPRITVRSDQMGEVPCIRGLRMPVSTVVGRLAAGATLHELLEDFPHLTPEDVREAMQYTAEVVLGSDVLPSPDPANQL